MTKARPRAFLAVAGVASAICFAPVAQAVDLRIAIMQAEAGQSRKYQPLLEYLASKGVAASFVSAPDYRAAAQMFASGRVHAMFSGSGVAGTMMIKGLADPLVRPVTAGGLSTYSAVVVAPKGSKRFDGKGSYFDGKRVIFTALASAGEFFFHSLGRSRPSAILVASSHGAAIDALSRGKADVAIVKNHVWHKQMAAYPSLEEVGADRGENPDGTLIVSKTLDKAAVQKVASIMLGLGGDPAPKAAKARRSLDIQGFIATGEKDFTHTLSLLNSAGVTKDFAFVF